MKNISYLFTAIMLLTLVSCESRSVMESQLTNNLYELNIPIEIKSPNPNETFSVTAYHTFAKTLSNTGKSVSDIQDTLKVIIPIEEDSIAIEVVQMVNEVAKKDTVLHASVKDHSCKVRIATHTNETHISLLQALNAEKTASAAQNADTFLSERNEF